MNGVAKGAQILGHKIKSKNYSNVQAIMMAKNEKFAEEVKVKDMGDE